MRTDYERQKKAIKVSMETADGKVFDAELMIFTGETLAGVMNGASAFMEVIETDGTKSLIAKSFIQRISQRIDEEVNDETGSGKWHHHAEDPYVVLGVPRDAPDKAVRTAYLKLARAYHPDKLAMLELAPAMMEYGQDILKKINVAYDMIVAERRKAGPSAA